MVELQVITIIAAPLERVFDLSRSVEVHLLGNVHSGEQATAGTCTGLIGPGEQITWRARHLGVRQHLTSAITAYERPHYFQDTMLRGAFHSMQHDHYFRELPAANCEEVRTEMRDVFRFAAPLGPFGILAERLVLRSYMQGLLDERNAVIKQVAESEEWRKYLHA